MVWVGLGGKDQGCGESMLESLEYSVWKFCSHGWERACPEEQLGRGWEVNGCQDPKSPLSPRSLSPPEWISIDKDEAGTKGKAPSVSRGSQEPR